MGAWSWASDATRLSRAFGGCSKLKSHHNFARLRFKTGCLFIQSRPSIHKRAYVPNTGTGCCGVSRGGPSSHVDLMRKPNLALSSRLPAQRTGRHEYFREDGASDEELLEGLLQMRKPEEGAVGSVYLIGTGPGDPELLTLKAIRLMKEADVVLYDRLVSEDILQLVNPQAFMVYVGKQQSYHTRTQLEIHGLLKLFATEGKATVLRLKGGDPFIFGRGGEEVEYLLERGVKVYTVPGITAASGISAELGIPLTHRGLATSVRFLTGHAREGGQTDIDEALQTCVDPHTTLVIYMGLGTLEYTSRTLIADGLSPMTPAVAVERGTTPEQRTVWATLGELYDAVRDVELVSPTLIIVGKVVALSPQWHQHQEQSRDNDSKFAC